MKKHLLLIIIAVFCVLNLIACGKGVNADIVQEPTAENVEQGSGAITQTSEVTQLADEKTDDKDAENDTPDSLLTNPDDSKYFKPETDDWLITVGTRDDYDPVQTRMTLYSFDTSGEMVQYITRITNSNGGELGLSADINQVKSADDKALYWDEKNDYYNEYHHVPDKFYTYYKLRDQRFVNVFYSLGLMKEDTEIENPEDAVYKEMSKVGELAGSDFHIYDLSFEEYDDATFSWGGKDVEDYDGFSLYRANIDCFDENGKTIESYYVILFDDEEHIDDYWMRGVGQDIDHYIETGEVRINQSEYERASKGFETIGNIIYKSQEVPASYYNKGEYMTGFGGYFSVPYLTESQIKYLTLME